MDNQSVNEAIEILINNFTNFAQNPSLNDSQLNVFELLQEFWQMKANGDLAASNQEKEPGSEVSSDQSVKGSLSVSASTSTSNLASSNIVYEFLETPGPPYICLVTLPNGSCFGTFQNSTTKMEARKNAALISLMNSIFNEHPLRRINDEFIKKSIQLAHNDMPNACPLSIDLYKRMLEMCFDKTLLEFKQMMTVFQLLQWNGSLKAMRERNCLLDEVIDFYKNFKIDDKMRSQMSLDWIAREQQEPGVIASQLEQVNKDIETARLNGQELRFLKEKRDILLLASYQFDIEIKAVN